jgi:23S rRNA pseudouridine1911/1915/1917 synthase
VSLTSQIPAPGCYCREWPVLYEDNHLLALYKPAGLLVQGDASGSDCLLELGKMYLKTKYQKPGRVFLGLVHRLDRPVAGVVVFARTSKAAARLSEQFRSGTLEKRYLAVVQGHLATDSGRWVDHLQREDRTMRVLASPQEGTQEARLRFQAVATAADCSLVEILLETGRRHQIRAQFAHRGHAILGDGRYGSPTRFPHRQIALLARAIRFRHPVRPDWLLVEAQLPQGWPWPGTIAAPPHPPWNWETPG